MDKVDGQVLLSAIAANKGRNREAARNAFEQFCGYYEEKVIQMAITMCNKWGKPEGYAINVVQCVFDKVWLYPTFNKDKSKIKDTDRAILTWMSWILAHELSLFSEKGNCSHPETEDLPLITSTTDFLQESCKHMDLSEDIVEAIKNKIDKTISGLNEQDRIIYLTYKLYLCFGKTVPRNVLKKMRTKLNMSQDAIRQRHSRLLNKIEG